MDRLNRLTGSWDGLGTANGVRLDRKSQSDPCDGAQEHVDQLFRTIETEIIPRLMLAHAPAKDCTSGVAAPAAPTSAPASEQLAARQKASGDGPWSQSPAPSLASASDAAQPVATIRAAS